MGFLNIGLFIDLSLTDGMLCTVIQREVSPSLRSWEAQSGREEYIKSYHNTDPCADNTLGIGGKSEDSQRKQLNLEGIQNGPFAHGDLIVKFDNGLCFGEKAKEVSTCHSAVS